MRNPTYVMFVHKDSKEKLILTVTRLFTQEKGIIPVDTVRWHLAQNGPGPSMRGGILVSSLTSAKSVLKNLDKKHHLIATLKCIIRTKHYINIILNIMYLFISHYYYFILDFSKPMPDPIFEDL